jgi:flagellar biosynthesis/type III secretory pathway protein FliH
MSRPGLVSRWTAGAPRILGAAPLPASPPVDQEAVRAQAEAAGYEAGFRAGQEAGAADARARAQDLLADLRRAVEEARTVTASLAAPLADLRDVAWRAAVLDVTEQVLGALFERDPELWRGYVLDVLSRCPPGPVVVRMAADALHALEAADEILAEAGRAVTWIAGATLSWTDLEVRWEHGGVWAGLRGRLWALLDDGTPPPL